jgi:ribosomal-protein-serine acetyltransferase
MNKPILFDLPVPIITPRLLLRPPHARDGKALNDAVIESFEHLNQWMVWAQEKPSVDDSEIYVRTSHAEWILRQQLVLLIFDRSTNMLLGSTGFHAIKWDESSFEIGYWIRSSCTNQGIATEATHAQLIYAFKHIKAARVQIKCNNENTASKRIPEKLGFTLEGILKNKEFNYHTKSASDTAEYARYDLQGLPHLEVNW